MMPALQNDHILQYTGDGLMGLHFSVFFCMIDSGHLHQKWASVRVR